MVIKLEKVLISDEVDPKCVEILQSNGIEVVKNTKLSKTELLSEIPKYDGLIVRSATKVTADVIKAGTNLKIIGRAGTGVDNIDTKAATWNGVIVMNTPGGNTLSAAEHTCTMIIALTRSLGAADRSMKEGKWDRKKFMGSELNGKTLGIIGLGRIGKEVALRMQSFGMTTIGFDPIIGSDVSSTFNTEWMDLESLWPKADYITVHTPLIPATRNLISDAVFAKCKKGVCVVNCARGGIIDEDALLRALESGQCGGAGLDVFVEEPPSDYTLAKHPKVIATPHLGASTVEAQSRVAKEIAEQFVDVVNGKSLFGAINAPALVNALSPSSQPWVNLGQRLGALGGSLCSGGGGGTIQITVTGNDLEKAGSYLQAAVLAGYLKMATNLDGMGTLNLVNSPVMAEPAGIKASSTHVPGNGRPSVKVEFCPSAADSVPVSVSGKVEGCVAQLTDIQGFSFPVPAMLEGNVILYKLEIAAAISDIIGAVLKDGGNVAAFSSSSVIGTKSYGVINMASVSSTNAFNSLKGIVAQSYLISL